MVRWQTGSIWYILSSGDKRLLQSEGFGQQFMNHYCVSGHQGQVSRLREEEIRNEALVTGAQR